MLGLSACLPPEADGLPPGSSSAPPSAATTPPATTQPDETPDEPPHTAPAQTKPGQTDMAPGNTPPGNASPGVAATPTAGTPAPAATTEPQPTAVAPGADPDTAEQLQESQGPKASPQEPTVVSWVPTGPIGPNDPAPGQRYLLLQQFQCDALAQSVEGAVDAAVWQAGAAVCRALQTGSQEDWQRASIAVAMTPRIPQRQCLEFRVAATSASVVAQYRSNPAGTFKAEPGPGEACPRQLRGLTVVDEDLRPVTGMTRASGPGTGGTIVRLDGYYVRVGQVLFDGVPVLPDIVAGGGEYQTLYLRMPPSQGRDTIRISITDTVDVAGTVTFFYDDPANSANSSNSSNSANTHRPPKTAGMAPGSGLPDKPATE
ncbi:hypothetical protein ACLRGI_12060 [Paenarthrobacter nitroguajacolicus]